MGERLTVSNFLDPAVLVVAALGLALLLGLRSPALTRRARAGRILAWAAWAALWAASSPWLSTALAYATEISGPDLRVALAGKAADRTALVVLAAGLRTHDRSLPPRERVDAATSARVLAAARLWQEHRFGLVILSGAPLDENEGMLDLATTLGLPKERVIAEARSENTRENARESARILGQHPEIEAVVLVTSATHLRRAMRDFASAGVSVIPAAAEVVGPTYFSLRGLLPSSWALVRTHTALHELLGMLRS